MIEAVQPLSSNSFEAHDAASSGSCRTSPPCKVVQLKPDTAYLAVRALRAYNANPSRQSIVQEICGVRGGSQPQCVGCIGKANAIMKLCAGINARGEG